MPLEIERKYLDAPLDEIRERLLALDAQSQGMHFESNIVFDTPDLALTGAGKLLRLRARLWPDREDFRLTFKGPAQKGDCGAKVREELECGVDDFKTMEHVLRNLGFTLTARYEKFRECWTVGGDCPMKIFLDILPFAHVVEKESELACIDALDKELGLDKLQISTKSYYELHQEWRVARGLDPTPGFIFGEERKNSLLRLRGIKSGASRAL